MRHIFILLLLIYSSTAISQTSREECTTIKDVCPGLGDVRNQSDGVCYAMGSADYLSCMLNPNSKQKISATDIIINMLEIAKKGQLNTLKSMMAKNPQMNDNDIATFKGLWNAFVAEDKQKNEDDINSRVLNGADAMLALYTYQAKEGGYCLETDLPSEQEGVNDYLSKYFDTLKAKANNTKLCHLESSENGTVQSLRRKCFDHIEILLNLANKSCARRYSIPPYRISSEVFSNTGNINDSLASSYISSELDNSKNPSLIAIDSRVFTDENYATEKDDGHKKMHAVNVVGREFIDGKCQFKIRNSWGNKCDVYTKKIQKHCKDGNGYVYLTEKQLNDSAAAAIKIDLLRKSK